MNKKIQVLLFLFILSSVFVFHSSAQAKNLTLAIPGNYNQTLVQNSMQSFLGENQNYSIVFRGNGEAVVSFKTILTNNSSDSLSKIILHFQSNIQPQDLAAFQVIADRSCIQYAYPQQSQNLQPTPTPFSLDYSNPNIRSIPVPSQAVTFPIKPQTCLEYSVPDFENLSGNIQYQAAAIDFSANTLTLSLPQPISPNQSGSYFLYYRTFAYTNKTLFGAFDFRFHTPQFENKINALQIGITTDSDLILRGNKGVVNYSGGNTPLAAPTMNTALGTIQNPVFDNYYNQIGQGDLTKNASNLQPFETYTVEGSFSTSQISLYGRDIAVGISILILIGIITFLLVKYILYRLKHSIKAPPTILSNTPTVKRVYMTLFAAGISFGSVMLLSVFVTAVYFFYQFLGTSPYAIIFILFLFLIALAVGGFLLFVPSILFALKKGWVWGFITFGMTLFWLLLFLFGSVIISSFFSSNAPLPVPMNASNQATMNQ